VTRDLTALTYRSQQRRLRQVAFRELAITAFILESTNLRVGQWKQARIETAVERLDAYLRDGALLV